MLLDELDLEVAPGESLAIIGPSGSGKTTLLNCISGLVRADAGHVSVAGETMQPADPRRRAATRLAGVGIVFQFAELLSELTVAENVSLPLRLRGTRDDDRVDDVLAAVSLTDRRDRLPDDLSGGEAQRAAIARSLVARPSVILADEPTGALDEELSTVICDLLVHQARTSGAALVTVTHDPLVQRAMDRSLRLTRGRLVAP